MALLCEGLIAPAGLGGGSGWGSDGWEFWVPGKGPALGSGHGVQVRVQVGGLGMVPGRGFQAGVLGRGFWVGPGYGSKRWGFCVGVPGRGPGLGSRRVCWAGVWGPFGRSKSGVQVSKPGVQDWCSGGPVGWRVREGAVRQVCWQLWFAWSGL